MFIPSSFRVDDRDALYAFLEQYSFATLVTAADGPPFATHLPLLLDRHTRALLGHLAAANPQWRAFDGAVECLAIFHGPHAYVSPTWYESDPAVPTWNYAVAHVYGAPRLLPAERTAEVVDRTVATYEAGRPQPWPNALPADDRQRLLAGVVGFELPIARIEGKFKLG